MCVYIYISMCVFKIALFTHNLVCSKWTNQKPGGGIRTPLNHAKQLNCVLVSFNIWRKKLDNTLLKLE
jgi:hypothetical protein